MDRINHYPISIFRIHYIAISQRDILGCRQNSVDRACSAWNSTYKTFQPPTPCRPFHTGCDHDHPDRSILSGEIETEKFHPDSIYVFLLTMRHLICDFSVSMRELNRKWDAGSHDIIKSASWSQRSVLDEPSTDSKIIDPARLLALNVDENTDARLKQLIPMTQCLSILP